MKPEFRNSITDSSCHAVSLGWRANAANQSSPAAFLFCLISSLSCSAQLLCHSSFSYQKRERYVLLSGLMLVHFSFIYARIYILWYLKTSFPSVTNARQYHFPLSQASALHVNRRTECWQIFVYFSFKSIFFFWNIRVSPYLVQVKSQLSLLPTPFAFVHFIPSRWGCIKANSPTCWNSSII